MNSDSYLSGQDSQSLRVAAESAARAVRDQLRDAFEGGIHVEQKANFHDVVSEHDRASERTIAEHITRCVPDSTILGEEGGRLGDGRVEWFVDPIDGTSNFVSQVPFFCVSIAAAVGGEVIAGVIYDPLRDQMFSADLDGAYADGVPTRSSGATRDQDALLLSGFPDYKPWADAPAGFAEQQEFARMLRSFRTVRLIGSAALCLAYVSCGRADVAFDVHLNAWDVAAGAFIVEQAGGRYLPLGGNGDRPRDAPGYLAYVGDFDIERSALATVARAGRPRRVHGDSLA